MTRDIETLTNVATYVSLSNRYANFGRWDEVAKVGTLIRDRGIKKKPRHSWIEFKKTFVVGDR